MNDKKKKYLVGTFILIIGIFLLVFMNTEQSAQDFFLKNYEDATEILHQEEFEKNRYLVFYFDKEGYINCSVMKKELIGYKILRTSGRLTLEATRYLCSFYEDQGDIKWVDWGIITDKTIECVRADEMSMNIIRDIPYGFWICWLTGSGEEPVNHTEGGT